MNDELKKIIDECEKKRIEIWNAVSVDIIFNVNKE